MLLSALTPDELERLAYLEPCRLDVARAHAAACHLEVERLRTEVTSLECEVDELTADVAECDCE